MSVEHDILEIAQEAKQAAMRVAQCSSVQKNEALLKIAEKLGQHAEHIKKENAKDLEAASQAGLSSAMMDRLTITDAVISGMADGLRDVAQLEDPVGAVGSSWLRPNGLQVAKMRIPLGVIGIIYESRPNVTIDAAGLCLKAGNAVILRGGSEALYSNQALAQTISEALRLVGLPEKAVQVVATRDRSAVNALLQQEEYIDLIIPRGGEGLIRFVVANSKIPVLKHYKGVCHVYVDESANLEMALAIAYNAKVHRPGVCNAMETLLVHQAIAEEFLPKMKAKFDDAGVELRGCERTCGILPDIVPPPLKRIGQRNFSI